MISWVRMVAVVAFAWKTEAKDPAARVRLNAMAASTSQAPFAAKAPEGEVGQRARSQVGVNLLDDGVRPVVGLGLQHRDRGVGEHGGAP